jgi:carboxymethylenebutenolidase
VASSVTVDAAGDARVFTPASASGPWPAVIFFMDGVGLREGLYGMGQRLADAGYFVLMPNLYWRAGPYAPFEPKTVFGDQGPERQRLMALVRTVDFDATMNDVGAYLKWLDTEPRVKKGPVGCTGYCLGGGMSLRTAGNYPDRVAAAAGFHAARLVMEGPSSPHLLAPKIKAELYFGISEIDSSHSPDTTTALERAFGDAKLTFQIETYPKVSHGFCVPDVPVYDAPAAERAWGKLLDLFQRRLQS